MVGPLSFQSHFLFLSVSVSVCISLFLSLFLSVSLSVSLSALSLYLFPSLFFSVYLFDCRVFIFKSKNLKLELLLLIADFG